jgi:DNA-binding transcriptional MerR regulator
VIAIRYPLVPRRSPRECLTLEAAAARVGLHPVLVERFVEFGLVEPAERTGSEVRLDAASLPRLVTISRLRTDLGVNLQGVAVILDLVDRLAVLERELTWLRQRGRLVPTRPGRHAARFCPFIEGPGFAREDES